MVNGRSAPFGADQTKKVQYRSMIVHIIGYSFAQQRSSWFKLDSLTTYTFMNNSKAARIFETPSAHIVPSWMLSTLTKIGLKAKMKKNCVRVGL